MSWGDGSGVPTSGKNLVVVGTDNNGLLHIRIFDAAGNRIKDTDETQLPAQAAAIATLKQQLPGLLPPHVLTDAEKAQVIAEATSIVGQTRRVLQLSLTQVTLAGQPGEPSLEYETPVEAQSCPFQRIEPSEPQPISNAAAAEVPAPYTADAKLVDETPAANRFRAWVCTSNGWAALEAPADHTTLAAGLNEPAAISGVLELHTLSGRSQDRPIPRLEDSPSVETALSVQMLALSTSAVSVGVFEAPISGDASAGSFSPSAIR